MDTKRKEQIEFEGKMFSLGLADFDRKHQQALDKNYATSSPAVMPLVFAAIDNFATQIRTQNEVANASLNWRNVEAKVMKSVCEAYCSLDDDRQDGTNIRQPELGYLLIATAVWKTVCDRAFSTQDLVSRVNLKTDIGNTLRLQLALLHSQDYCRANPNNIEEIAHLLKIEKEITDNSASLTQRMKRATGLFNEVASGCVEIRARGRQTNPVKLFYPPEAQPAAWSSHYKEVAGSIFLDLLCVPKGQDPEPDDPRPFFYEHDKKHGDTIRVRENFKATLIALRERFSNFLFSPLPMLAEPGDWIVIADSNGGEINNGGYYSEELKNLNPLVRSGFGTKETLPSQLMVDLLNRIQRTEWRLDKDQFEMVQHINLTWESDYDGILRPKPYTFKELKDGTGDVVKLIPEVQFKHQNTERIDAVRQKLTNGEELTWDEKVFWDEWEAVKRRFSTLYDEVEKSKKRSTNFVDVRRRFSEFPNETFYYPWNFDYRTRLYPIPGVSTPQGAPVERYSLRFASAEHLSPDGENAALRAIGAAAKDTKGSIQSRIDWARQNLDLVRFLGTSTDAAIAEAKHYDEPLQLLQLCREWLRHEDGEAWSVPVYADATNSGFQIVSALINSTAGLHATNVCASDPTQAPNDAYRETQRQVIEWLRSDDPDILGSKTIDRTERDQLLTYLVEDGKPSSFGRSLSKTFGKTAIYGSAPRTQVSDLMDEFKDKGISREEAPHKLVRKLVSLINRAYTSQLGDVLSFNPSFKSMLKKRIAQQVEPELLRELRTLSTERQKAQTDSKSGGDLRDKALNRLIVLARQAHAQITDLTFQVQGSTIDLRDYLQTTKEFLTAFHGKPTCVIRHDDAIDYKSIIKSAPPNLIHHIDSLILAHAFHDAPFDLTTIHDSAGCLPNHFDEMCRLYRVGFAKATAGDILDDIANQWGVAQEVTRFETTEWRSEIPDSVYLFN